MADYSDRILGHVWNNRQRRPAARHIGPTATYIVSKLKRSGATSFDDIVSSWMTIIPDCLRDKCQPLRFSRGVLTVAVTSSAIKFELEQFDNGRLLEMINNVQDSARVTSIRWVVGRR